MARVLPFRAVRPVAPAGSLAERLSPPYDVISPAERERLARAPHNPVHLILPQDDAGPGSRYAHAARTLTSWIAEGALARDASPALYPYEQLFTHRARALARRGFFGLLELAEFGEAGVFAHERTLTAPKEDRFRLLEATRANLSPVFVLYEDKDGSVACELDRARGPHPLASARTHVGEESLWSLGEGAPAASVSAALESQGLVFADGHHRYESALRDRRERRAAEPGAPWPQSYDFMLACFVEAHDPGLLVLPTHRVLRGLPEFTAEDLVLRLSGIARAVPLGEAVSPEDAVRRAEEFLAAHPAGAYVLVTARDTRVSGIVIDPDGAARALSGGDISPALRDLDVVQLHELVFARGLGITAEALAAQSHVEYAHDSLEAVRTLRGGGGAGAVAGASAALPAVAAFLLNATPIEQVLSVARAGGRMPQKSTYFLPKITTGWTYHVHGAPNAIWGPAVLDSSAMKSHFP